MAIQNGEAAAGTTRRGDDAQYDNELPELVASTRRGPGPPRLGAAPPFFLAVHPERWMVLAGRIVPRPVKIKLMNGLNGCERTRSGKWSAAAMIASWEEQGWTILEHDIDDRPYMHKPKGTAHWMTRWEKAYAGSTHISTDVEGYAEWLHGLVEAGKIERIRPYVLEKLRDQLSGDLADLETTAVQSAAAMRRIERVQNDLKLVAETIGDRELVEAEHDTDLSELSDLE